MIRESNARIVVCDLPRLSISEVALVRVFQNLIKNAIQYRNAARPEVVIRVSTSSERWTTISIADNGIGIPESQYTNVFRRFRRLNPTSVSPFFGAVIAQGCVFLGVLGEEGRVNPLSKSTKRPETRRTSEDRPKKGETLVRVQTRQELDLV